MTLQVLELGHAYGLRAAHAEECNPGEHDLQDEGSGFPIINRRCARASIQALVDVLLLIILAKIHATVVQCKPDESINDSRADELESLER